MKLILLFKLAIYSFVPKITYVIQIYLFFYPQNSFWQTCSILFYCAKSMVIPMTTKTVFVSIQIVNKQNN